MIRENEKNFVEAAASPRGPFKYMTKDQIA